MNRRRTDERLAQSPADMGGSFDSLAGAGRVGSGSFFVQIADADHVFFAYKPRETSKAVSEMFPV
jgi:hypothetical protein